MSLLSLLRRWYLRQFGELRDDAWKPTGVKAMSEWSYDEAKAVAGARRARRRSASGKALHRPKPTPCAKVLPMGERKQAR